mgnify:CR=1 FL=1
MKILLDAMGGDNAPKSTVQGAADAVKEFGDGMTLALLLALLAAAALIAVGAILVLMGKKER